ncbi:MAG: hypothetical protein AB2540_05890 [Candidatus Thiodiazotropha endolucinida]
MNPIWNDPWKKRGKHTGKEGRWAAPDIITGALLYEPLSEKQRCAEINHY